MTTGCQKWKVSALCVLEGPFPFFFKKKKCSTYSEFAFSLSLSAFFLFFYFFYALLWTDMQRLDGILMSNICVGVNKTSNCLYKAIYNYYWLTNPNRLQSHIFFSRIFKDFPWNELGLGQKWQWKTPNCLKYLNTWCKNAPVMFQSPI